MQVAKTKVTSKKVSKKQEQEEALKTTKKALKKQKEEVEEVIKNSKKASKKQEEEEQQAVKTKRVYKKKALKEEEKIEEPVTETKPASQPQPEPPEPQIVEETSKSIGVDSINIIIDTLESVSIQDILSNENPDISTVSNNLLAIS
jgi:hypothetical protein